MLNDTLAVRILSGEQMELVTVDEECLTLQSLQRSLSSLGRNAGARCIITSRPTARGDDGQIILEDVAPAIRERVVAILQSSPLNIVLKHTDRKVDTQTHP